MDNAFPYEWHYEPRTAVETLTMIEDLLELKKDFFTVRGKLTWLNERKDIDSQKRHMKENLLNNKTDTFLVSVWDAHFEILILSVCFIQWKTWS